MNKFFQILLLGVCACGVLSAQTATAPSAGDGSAGNPYQITTLENLYWITADAGRWESHYIQTADIDASVTSGWDSGNGWTPIGNTAGSPFRGSYNGQGHAISNLFISRSGSNGQGLFGYINNNEETRIIQNVRLLNVSITGMSQVGGLAGYCNINIIVSNCFSTGTIAGNDFIGGLVGYNHYSTVKNSSSACTVTGMNNIGGLAGFNHGTTSFISGCYSTGSVTDTGTGSSIGGLVGGNLLGNVNDCYSTSTVSGYYKAGGLIGEIDKGIVTACYSMGSVTGTYSVGGLVGNNEAGFGTITNCFWNTQTSGQASSSGGTGKTTAAMTTDALVLNYETNIYLKGGWDFKDETTNGENEIWNIGNSRNNGYPYLDWQYPGDDGALPVELASFTASAINNSAALAWKTATEVHNYGFEIERRTVSSQNSSISSPHRGGSGWGYIGFVQGAGTNNTPKEYSYTDAAVASGTYAYRLKQIDNDGTYKYSGEAEVTVSVPNVFALNQNYPNPFNPSTTMSFTLAQDGYTTLKIYDVLGKEVATLIDGEMKAGVQNTVTFDASKLSSGVYFSRLASSGNVQLKKMLLLK